MEKSEIIMSLSNIFKDVFSDSSIVITDNLSAKDVDEWDSLTNLSLMAMVDSDYNVKLNADEINESETLLDLFTLIKSKQ